MTCVNINVHLDNRMGLDDCALAAGKAQCTLIVDRTGTSFLGLEIVDGTKMDKNFERIE